MYKDVARCLLEHCRADLKAAKALINSSEDVSDCSIGFHLQQAVEKGAKVWLFWHRISHEKTHDLFHLFDKIGTRKTVPEGFDILKSLSPFAVEGRYGGCANYQLKDRSFFLELTNKFVDWAVDCCPGLNLADEPPDDGC